MEELRKVAAALGETAIGARVLAGGFSHETSLLTLASGPVVVRLGGSDHAIEAAVMAAARQYVPVPEIIAVLDVDGRSAMVLEYVTGTPLSDALDDGSDFGQLGAEVGRLAALIGSASFDSPGFFADASLHVAPQRPWSEQLPEFGAQCMDSVPATRLDPATRTAWADLCAAHAPALTSVDDQARLAHADLNPKNILVTHGSREWRVDAILDWEFSYSGCPYADAANMARFGADYPGEFLNGFTTAFAGHLAPPGDWRYLGRVLDMFALSDLVTRPPGHLVADQAAQVIRQWVATGIPDAR